MKEMICIICPRGCHLHIDSDMNVTGNTCLNGKKYAISELTNPVRTITTIAKTINGKYVSVKSNLPIPKDKVFLVMKEINKLVVNIPIKVGDVVIKNILNLNIDIIATKNIN